MGIQNTARVSRLDSLPSLDEQPLACSRTSGAPGVSREMHQETTCALGLGLGTQLGHNPGMVTQGKERPRPALPCFSELALQSQAGDSARELPRGLKCPFTREVRACHVWDQRADVSQVPLQHRGLCRGRRGALSLILLFFFSFLSLT